MAITGYASTSSPSIQYIFTAFYVLTVYTAAEVLILVFMAFKRYSGCYFWSLIVTAIALIVSAFGRAYYFYANSPNKYVALSFGVLGWAVFVPGQAIVLWSRLHLVIRSVTILRGVLFMIIFNTIALCIPTIILTYLLAVQNPRPRVAHAYRIWESVQLTVFCAQEAAISGIYIWQTIQLLKLVTGRSKRKIIYELLTINVIILMMDAVLLGVQYSDDENVQLPLTGLVYSLKLILELAVLSRLVCFVKQSGGNDASQECGLDGPAFSTTTTTTASGSNQMTSGALQSKKHQRDSSFHSTIDGGISRAETCVGSLSQTTDPSLSEVRLQKEMH